MKVDTLELFKYEPAIFIQVQRREMDTVVQMWIEAATLGCTGAQYNLGVLYEDGRSVSQSDVEAVRWLQMAADQVRATNNKTSM